MCQLAVEQLAVLHADGALRDPGHVGIMGDHDDRPALSMQILQDAQDDIAVLGVEIAGRFVCQKDGRVVGQCPGNGHPLGFPPGQLGRVMIGAFGQPDLGEQLQRPCLPFRSGDTPKRQGQFDILCRRLTGNELKGLENHPHTMPPMFHQAVLALGKQVGPFKADLTGGGGVQSAEQVQEGRLPGAGLADDGEEFALVDIKADIVDCRDSHGGFAIDLANVVNLDEGHGQG